MARKTQPKKQGLKLKRDASRILRTVGEEKAFYFYSAIGEPTGEKAASLLAFSDKVKTVKLESLRFHLRRKDFHNWLETTIGDSRLARKIRVMRSLRDAKLRIKMSVAIEARIRELSEETGLSISVNEDLILTSTSW